ncbi:TldD/PmbA family protein [Thermosynechococcaceae cyanobacterium BACA0444]|uniref:TldD/PmbA family protein n=1 Tax=Pseudocalidococcus azoricus BACA0444 TaxID=2918990 RepID=A0AAE4FV14_9CYAN|nr:TldD/PmbA family protein [Pseudocalidococcus azoricus]MDS3861415.1 TldD/PmbA family protein [Pseudocalidococcus azoricus BACA0444]
MTTDVSSLMTLVETTAQQLGLHKYDLGGSQIDEVSVQVQNGQPKQVKASQRSGITVRVWNQQGQMGVTSTTDLDRRGLELALGMARDASHFGVTEHIPDFSPQAQAPVAPIDLPPVTPAPASELVQKLVAAEQAVIEAHPAISSVPYNGLSQRGISRFYLNSEGAMRQEGGTYTSIYLYSKTDVAGRKPRSAGAFRLSYGLEDLDIASCIAETIEKTTSHLDYQPIASGHYPVIFSPEAFLSLLSAFSNLFNAQSILDGQSLSTPDSLGLALAVPELNVFDDARHPEHIGATTFDGEGTPTQRTPLIEQGILTGLLHSAGTAKRLQAQPTGHANMGAKVTVSSHFYDVSPGREANSSYNLATVDGVVYVDDLHALHAGVKALQGSFSLPFDGWLLKNGERISIESATVAGDFRAVLKQIVHLDPVAQFTQGGFCPLVWVDGLAITGE